VNLTTRRLGVAAWAALTLTLWTAGPRAAWALDVVPTFVDEPAGTSNRQVWDATRQAVIQSAITDWEARVLNSQTVNVTFDFTRVGTANYLAQWDGTFSVSGSTNLFPWTSGVTHFVHFNSDQILRSGTSLVFVPASQSPTSNQWDALTVARHEVGHMLGFVDDFYRQTASNPSSDKWAAQITINGANATFDAPGLNVPLASSSDLSHILDSGAFANDLMTAALPNGERRGITQLHLDMLKKAYGYDVVPEPAGLVVLAPALGALALLRLRRAA
jgi:hypothetical protein